MRFLFPFLLFCITACGNQSATGVMMTEKMLGNWQRINDEDGKVTTETWDKVNARYYAGKGETRSEGELSFSEDMVLSQTDGKWTLKVSGPNDDPVLFDVALFADSLVATNFAHDFPTKIKYWVEGEKLLAAVSNSEMVIDFAFVRK